MAQDNRRLKRKVRNSIIISTISISLVLFLLGSMGFLLFNALKLTAGIEESMTVHVMLQNSVERNRCDSLRRCLEAEEGVGRVIFVPKEKAAEEFAAEIGSDFVEFLKFNPLPDAFEVGFNAGEAGRDAVAAFEKRVTRWPEVEQVVYQKAVVEQIGSNINKFNVVLLFVGGTLLVISHDRYLINKLADRVYKLTADGVENYLGNYDYYLEKQQTAAAQTVSEKPKRSENALDYKQRKERGSERRKLNTRVANAEKRIEELDAEINAKTEELSTITDYQKAMELSEELERLRLEQESEMEEWETASALLEGFDD